jgi:hypothetical protein
MAFHTLVEIRVAKGAAVVMARHTTLRATAPEMLHGARRCHLHALRRTRAQVVTVVTA